MPSCIDCPVFFRFICIKVDGKKNNSKLAYFRNLKVWCSNCLVCYPLSSSMLTPKSLHGLLTISIFADASCMPVWGSHRCGLHAQSGGPLWHRSFSLLIEEKMFVDRKNGYMLSRVQF